MLGITIARLGPGQEIELEAHAVKGIGKTHAKWSPVATAWYRMLPEIVLIEDVEDEDAEKLVKTCPVNVFDIEDIGSGKKRANLARPHACTLCRECLRCGEEWEKRVSIRRVKDHFICGSRWRLNRVCLVCLFGMPCYNPRIPGAAGNC